MSTQQQQTTDYKQVFLFIFENDQGKETAHILMEEYSLLKWNKIIHKLSLKQDRQPQTFQLLYRYNQSNPMSSFELINENQCIRDIIPKSNTSINDPNISIASTEIVVVRNYYSINYATFNQLNKWLFCPAVYNPDNSFITLKDDLILSRAEGEPGHKSVDEIGYKVYNAEINEWSTIWLDLHVDFGEEQPRSLFFNDKTKILYVTNIDKGNEENNYYQWRLIAEAFPITLDTIYDTFEYTNVIPNVDTNLQILNPKSIYHSINSLFTKECPIIFSLHTIDIWICQIDDKTIHIIVTYCNKETDHFWTKHFVWNIITNNLQLLHTIDNQAGFGLSFIYLRKQKCLMLIGSYMGIMKYCLIKKKWEKIQNIKFSLENIDCLPTDTENKIIIAGGYKTSTNSNNALFKIPSDKIWIYNVTNNTLKESCVVLPYPGPCKILKTGSFKDELLLFGWIKKIFKQKKFEQIKFPPTYLIKLILLWYNVTMMHWMYNLKSDIPKHQAIQMSCILNNIKKKC